MASQVSTTPVEKSQKIDKSNNVYYRGLLNKNINLPFKYVGRNIDQVLHQCLGDLENKCNEDGFIKQNSIKIINYSSGTLNGSNVKFNVNFECDICNPSEGIEIDCKVLNVSKAGIRAALDVEYGESSPLMVFVIRDHHYSNDAFNELNENDLIKIKIIGSRFELNDDYVTVIGEI
jgi:DNA-directed RNA polymerase subunit E'/Rpb7